VTRRLKLVRLFEKAIASIQERSPPIVLLIDYPGLIPLFARKLRKKGYTGKIIQYICPSLLFCRQKDRKAMAETLDALLCIFPFEPSLFKNSPFPVNFVGHPALEKLKNYVYAEGFREKFSIPSDAPLIGIFPGSRSKVLKANFPSQLLAALKLQKEIPSSWIGISVANEKSKKTLEPLASSLPHVVFIPENHAYDLMQACCLAIATSGTIALELALHEKPAVMTYCASLLDIMVVKYYAKWPFPHYCLVNVLMNDNVYPELIYKESSPDKIHKEARALYFSPERKKRCIAQCRELKNILSLEPPATPHPSHTSDRVADLLLSQ
jgi:lipid-A-disaccharide synthase